MIKSTIIHSLIIIAVISPPALAQFSGNRPSFFRDGYDQMQQEIQRLQQQSESQTPQQQIEHPSQLLTIKDGQLRWQKMIFRDAGFSVWMPQGIQSEENIPLNTPNGVINFEVFATHPQSLRYVAAYSEILPANLLSQPQTLLDAIREGILGKTQYKLKDDQAISWQTYQGRELSLENDGEIITFRVYLIGQRVFVLAASQQETQGISQNVTDFFASFRLLN